MADANGKKGEESSERNALLPILQLGFVVVAAIVVYSFVSVAKEGEARRRCSAECILHPNYAGADRTLPSAALHDLKGNVVNLDQYRGKVVVLNFWTKTCGPCLEEMPEIADLTRILASRSDVVVVAVSTDDTAKEVSDTLKSVLRGDAPFTTLIDPDAQIVNGKFGTHLFPETWIVDKNGVIRARFDGAREWSNPAVIEMVDDVRGGGYCPIEVKNGTMTGQDAKVCEAIRGS